MSCFERYFETTTTRVRQGFWCGQQEVMSCEAGADFVLLGLHGQKSTVLTAWHCNFAPNHTRADFPNPFHPPLLSYPQATHKSTVEHIVHTNHGLCI